MNALRRRWPRPWAPSTRHKAPDSDAGRPGADGTADLRAQGRRISRQPRFGARFDAGGRVQADPREQATLTTILLLREASLSLDAISATLAGQGILARSGQLLTASTLGQLVRQGTLADSLAS